MASNNMQFTIQASVMMSMCYICASAIRIKDSLRLKALMGKCIGSDKWLLGGFVQRINTILPVKEGLEKISTASLCDDSCRTVTQVESTLSVLSWKSVLEF